MLILTAPGQGAQTPGFLGPWLELPGVAEFLGTASELARDYLTAMGRPEWEPEMRLMIHNHHKVRPYTGAYAPMVDAMRKADWIDVTFRMPCRTKIVFIPIACTRARITVRYRV